MFCFFSYHVLIIYKGKKLGKACLGIFLFFLGNFQQHHVSHLHNATSVADSHFLDLVSSQQQQQSQISELNINSIYQQDLLSQQLQNQIYSNLPISENMPFLPTPNQNPSSSLPTSTMGSGLSNLISAKNAPTSAKQNKTTVRRGRSTTKTKITVPSVTSDGILSLQKQQSSYGSFDNEISGGRSSSISNYSRSLSPNSSGIASKVSRKSRSRTKDSEDDDGRSIEDKEAERRTANNTRERYTF